MTKREAMRYVCSMLATEARHHAANGSEWLFTDDAGEDFSEADQVRLLEALEYVASGLERRGGSR